MTSFARQPLHGFPIELTAIILALGDNPCQNEFVIRRKGNVEI
jgi:hypothetical protein